MACPGKPSAAIARADCCAQVGEDAALHDAEQGLVGAGLGLQAALGPGVGALHGALASRRGRRAGRIHRRP